MKNLFKGAQITINEALINNDVYNAVFDRDGFRQHMLPARESSIAAVDRVIGPFLAFEGAKREYEFTRREKGVITLYFSSPKALSAIFRDALASHKLITSVTYGSMKVDATFHTTK